MKKLFIFMLLISSLSSCWAPRCPIKSCQYRMEHRHDDLVSGIFMGRFLAVPTFHFLWDKEKGESNPDTKFTPSGKTPNRKLRKKFPWERW